MRKSCAIAAAGAALGLGYAGIHAATPDQASAPGWVSTLLPLSEDGWEKVAATPTLVVYAAFESVVRKGAMVTAPVRAEWMDPQDTPPTPISDYMSSISQIEFNCGAGSYRDISVLVYADRNLTGESSSPNDNTMAAWSTVLPEAIGQQLLTAACKRTETRQTPGTAPTA